MDKESKFVVRELQENPFHSFNNAFAVMVLLPFLTIIYILVSQGQSLDVLSGRTGLILFISIFIAISGYLLAYGIIRRTIKRVMYYAAKAKRSDELKSTLVASVAHEIKNPLYTLKWGFFSFAEDIKDKINPEQAESIKMCNDTIDRMSRMVDELLDIYKIEAGMVDLNRQLCDLNELLNAQLKEFGIAFRDKNIWLIKEYKENNIYAWVDKDKVLRVFNNLLSNALKYTPASGSITVKIFRDDDFIRIEFYNTGKGIPKDKLSKIFDKFQRLDKSQEGVGLGLAMSKDIVELHKGRIWVESEWGHGSRFIVLLPRSLRRGLKK
jgi:two-component system sensor histidine kinase VicK